MNTQNNSESSDLSDKHKTDSLEPLYHSKSVQLNNQTSMKINNELFESVFRIVKESEPLSENSHLSLILSNDGSIKKYNKQYLGRNELTDVISFQADIPGTGFLGDIIIDTNVADKQKDDRTLEEELQIIFLHGLLHLCGYDHLAANQEKIMKNKEKLYWNQLVNTYKLKENRSIKNK